MRQYLPLSTVSSLLPPKTTKNTLLGLERRSVGKRTQEDLSSILRTNLKKTHVAVCACNSSTNEVDQISRAC